MTFWLLVHPDERHGRTQVSGTSRDVSGPSARSSSRMSWWHAPLSAIHWALSTCHSLRSPEPGQAAISAW